MNTPTCAERQWLRLGMHVRLALQPDEPRLIARYLAVGDALVVQGWKQPWPTHDRMLSLLLATAYDVALPMAWRGSCLDACCRPLASLGPLVCDDASAARLREHSWRLAHFSRDSEASE